MKNVTNVYIVGVKYDKEVKISQEAFRNHEGAAKFICCRDDKPERINDFKYKSELYTYYIYEVYIKKEPDKR